MMSEKIEQPKPTIWEGIAIAAGAIALVGISLAGLWTKAFNNSYDPERAEAIAKSLITYDIPGGSRGVIGVNIGGSKTAFITSKTILPELKNLTELDKSSRAEVQLWIARVPVRRTTDAEDSPERADESLTLSPPLQDGFQVTEKRTEEHYFCGYRVPVQIAIGQMVLGSQKVSVPAILYNANAIVNSQTRSQYQISLLALGRDPQSGSFRAREATAQKIFNSIECRP